MTSLFVPLLAQSGATQTVLDFLQSGGQLMIPIGVCSVLVLAFTFERMLSLSRRRLLPRSIDEALELIEAGRVDDAASLTAQVKAPSARVLAAGIRRKGFDLRDVEGAMEDQANKELEKLRKNIRPITLIAGIAPLLGLLGTVLGIADAFHQVVDAGMGKPEVLAAGIELALTTTIAGLCVAIPAMVLAAWLQGKVRRLMMAVDERLSPAIEQLARRPAAEESHAA